MSFRSFAVLLLAGPGIASGQFVWPKPEYHRHDESAYKEDSFITKYRTKFFAVFRGDFKTFDKALAEIQEMVKRNPNDARALVWLGNGETVKASLLYRLGKRDEGIAMVKKSRETMERAVSLRPHDYGIYMMQAATLYIQGQYWPPELIPTKNWTTLRDDCLRFINDVGPRINQTSVHVRGEAYGELGVAYTHLGDKRNARLAFEKVAQLDPGTDYAVEAQKQIEKLAG